MEDLVMHNILLCFIACCEVAVYMWLKSNMNTNRDVYRSGWGGTLTKLYVKQSSTPPEKKSVYIPDKDVIEAISDVLDYTLIHQPLTNSMVGIHPTLVIVLVDFDDLLILWNDCHLVAASIAGH